MFCRSSSSWQHTAKQTFIENQIELCKHINSPDEMKYWYSNLGYHLSCHGTETRIRLLLDDLLGPVHLSLSSSSSSALKKRSNRNNDILGIDKHLLLRDILGHLKMQHQWQRLWMEYSEQLNILDKQKINNTNENDVIMEEKF